MLALQTTFWVHGAHPGFLLPEGISAYWSPSAEPAALAAAKRYCSPWQGFKTKPAGTEFAWFNFPTVTLHDPCLLIHPSFYVKLQVSLQLAFLDTGDLI